MTGMRKRLHMRRPAARPLRPRGYVLLFVLGLGALGTLGPAGPGTPTRMVGVGLMPLLIVVLLAAIAVGGLFWRGRGERRHTAWGGCAPAVLMALALAVAEGLARGPGRPRELVLVPMPSQGRSVRERGLDTTRLLARTAARTLASAGLPTRVEATLRHVRRVADQSELGEHDRRTNLVGALVARPGRPALRVVVDDLTTTGSSLHEACRALAEAGTPASGCAVVAATPRRHRRHADNGGTLR